jgi:hypothetical protein
MASPIPVVEQAASAHRRAERRPHGRSPDRSRNIVSASDSSPARELAVAPNEGLQERGGSPLGACDIRMVWIWTTSAIPETLRTAMERQGARWQQIDRGRLLNFVPYFWPVLEHKAAR